MHMYTGGLCPARKPWTEPHGSARRTARPVQGSMHQEQPALRQPAPWAYCTLSGGAALSFAHVKRCRPLLIRQPWGQLKSPEWKRSELTTNNVPNSKLYQAFCAKIRAAKDKIICPPHVPARASVWRLAPPVRQLSACAVSCRQQQLVLRVRLWHAPALSTSRARRSWPDSLTGIMLRPERPVRHCGYGLTARSGTVVMACKTGQVHGSHAVRLPSCRAGVSSGRA